MIQNDYEIESIPESAWQVSRRSFIKRLAGGIAAGGAPGLRYLRLRIAEG